MTTGDVMTCEGRVRGLAHGESPAAGEYARIRLAGDPRHFMDFDSPEFWIDMKGHFVRLTYVEQTDDDNNVWRVVLDSWEVDDG